MTAEEFIQTYLAQICTNVICLHNYDNMSSITFDIAELHKGITEPEFYNRVSQYFVSQIVPKVEVFNGGLNIVIHIHTTRGYEEA